MAPCTSSVVMTSPTVSSSASALPETGGVSTTCLALLVGTVVLSLGSYVAANQHRSSSVAEATSSRSFLPLFIVHRSA
jgi:hypothetical protein